MGLRSEVGCDVKGGDIKSEVGEISWVGTASIGWRWEVNGHTTRCTVVSECEAAETELIAADGSLRLRKSLLLIWAASFSENLIEGL